MIQMLHMPPISPEQALDKAACQHYTDTGAQYSPSGIVVISPLWRTTHPCLGTTTNQLLQYDFPDPTRRHLLMSYRAARAPHLAEHIVPALKKHYPKVFRKETYKLDHGAWMPLYHLFPSALTPVIQLSLPNWSNKDAFITFGKTLATLSISNLLLLTIGEKDTPTTWVSEGAKSIIDAVTHP